MSSSCWRLTPEHKAIARILRFEQRMSWRKIGERFGCNEETVQRAIDPRFEAHKRAVYQRRKEELAKLRQDSADKSAKVRRSTPRMRVALPASPTAYDEEAITRRKSLKSDKAFCEAMRGAIGCGQEHATIGIDTRPSSPDARFHPMRGVSAFSATGSPAGMCSDH